MATIIDLTRYKRPKAAISKTFEMKLEGVIPPQSAIQTDEQLERDIQIMLKAIELVPS